MPAHHRHCSPFALLGKDEGDPYTLTYGTGTRGELTGKDNLSSRINCTCGGRSLGQPYSHILGTPPTETGRKARLRCHPYRCRTSAPTTATCGALSGPRTLLHSHWQLSCSFWKDPGANPVSATHRLSGSGKWLLPAGARPSPVKQREGSTVQRLRAQPREPGSVALNARSAEPVVRLTSPGCKPGMTTVCGTPAFVRKQRGPLSDVLRTGLARRKRSSP